jgi:hypothetical protein
MTNGMRRSHVVEVMLAAKRPPDIGILPNGGGKHQIIRSPTFHMLPKAISDIGVIE